MKQYAKRPTSPSSSKPKPAPLSQPPLSPSPGEWSFDDRVRDTKPGFQLTQLCMCYYTNGNDSAFTPGPAGAGGGKRKRMPVAVSTMQYSVDKGL